MVKSTMPISNILAVVPTVAGTFALDSGKGDLDHFDILDDTSEDVPMEGDALVHPKASVGKFAGMLGYEINSNSVALRCAWSKRGARNVNPTKPKPIL